jgi:uncharacterized Zn-finger protein
LPIHQPPYPFHCLYCDLKYKTRAQLNVHLPKHMNAKPFVCEICQTGFKWKHALKCHMATHSNTFFYFLLCHFCVPADVDESDIKSMWNMDIHHRVIVLFLGIVIFLLFRQQSMHHYLILLHQ